MNERPRYIAFISYRHGGEDERWARLLHESLERFRSPASLVREGKPSRLGKVFRDQDELAAHSNLGTALQDALTRSEFLIVVCSRRTPESTYVDQEVQYFRSLGRDDRILLLLIEGEPNESFPRSLREMPGLPALEPLAADARQRPGMSIDQARRDAITRLQAALLRVGYDDLRQREAIRRRRRRVWLGFVSVLAFALIVVAGSAVKQAIAVKKLATYRAALDRDLDAHQNQLDTWVDIRRKRADRLPQVAANYPPAMMADKAQSIGEELLQNGESSYALAMFRFAAESKAKLGNPIGAAESQLGWAQCLWELNCNDEALDRANHAQATLRSALPPGDERVWLAALTTADGLMHSKKLAEAQAEFQHIIDATKAQGGPTPPLVATAIYDLGLCIQLRADAARDTGDHTAALEWYTQAITHMRDAWQRRRSLLGEDHPETLICPAELGRMLRRGAGEHASLAKVANDQAAAQAHAKHAEDLTAEAIACYRFVIDRLPTRVGESSWRLAQARANLATAYLRSGKAEESIPLYQRALDRFKDPGLRGPWHADTLTIVTRMNEALRSINRADDANALLVQISADLATSLPVAGPCTTTNDLNHVEAFAKLLDGAGLTDKAALVRHKINEVQAPPHVTTQTPP